MLLHVLLDGANLPAQHFDAVEEREGLAFEAVEMRRVRDEKRGERVGGRCVPL